MMTPSGPGSSRRRKRPDSRDGSEERSAAIRILEDIEKEVVGGIDAESRRKSHSGRLDELEGWRETMAAWQADQVRQQEEQDRRHDEADAHLVRVDRWRDQVDVKLQTPPVQQSAAAFRLSKRTIQIITAVATFLAAFVAALIAALRGGT